MTPQQFDEYVAYALIGVPRRVALGKKQVPTTVQIEINALIKKSAYQARSLLLSLVPAKWPFGGWSFVATVSSACLMVAIGVNQLGKLDVPTTDAAMTADTSKVASVVAENRLPPPVTESTKPDIGGTPKLPPNGATRSGGIEFANEPYPLPNPLGDQPRTGQPLQPQVLKPQLKSDPPKADEQTVKAVVVDVPEKVPVPTTAVKQTVAPVLDAKEPAQGKAELKPAKASSTDANAGSKTKPADDATKPQSADKDAGRITIVDIHSKGEFALITDPKTRLPKKYGIGEKIHTGETLHSIDPASGSIKVGDRIINIQ